MNEHNRNFVLTCLQYFSYERADCKQIVLCWLL